MAHGAGRACRGSALDASAALGRDRVAGIFQRRGYPQTPADLLNHDCIRMGLGRQPPFQMGTGRQRRDGHRVQGRGCANDTDNNRSTPCGVASPWLCSRTRDKQEGPPSKSFFPIGVLPVRFFAYLCAPQADRAGLRQIIAMSRKNDKGSADCIAWT